MDNRKKLATLEDLLGAYPELGPAQRAATLRFYDCLLRGNAEQNLTRLIEPRDFCEGHLEDVLALFKSGLADFPAMDLGSGGGVPGLLAASLRPDSWILCDSEGHKAEFLRKSADDMGLKHVQVVSGRAEHWLRDNSCSSVIARAVGKAEKIFGWIGECSTWNSLVLFKGPGWSEEWREFLGSRHRKRLIIDQEYAYSVGQEKKERRIVRLSRVPRGTAAR